MNERKSEILAALITLLITGGVVAFLLLYMLPVLEIPKHEQYVTMMEDPGGDELAKLGNTPEPTPTEQQDDADSQNSEEATDEVAEPSGDELKDAGPQAPTPPKTITTPAPSPMKVKEKEKPTPEKTGSKSENPKPKAKPANERNDAPPAESQISKNMKGAFGKSNGTGKTQGSPTGGSNAGSLTGHGALGGGLDGYTVAFWGRPHSRYVGSVTCRVHVNARGQVTQAQAVSGSGEAWSHQEVRNYCVQESLKSRFSVPKSRTTEGIGTITWHFK